MEKFSLQKLGPVICVPKDLRLDGKMPVKFSNPYLLKGSRPILGEFIFRPPVGFKLTLLYNDSGMMKKGVRLFSPKVLSLPTDKRNVCFLVVEDRILRRLIWRRNFRPNVARFGRMFPASFRPIRA